MNFYNDLKFGKFYENELVKVLKPKKFEIKEGNHKEYDVTMTDLFTIYYEVKSDRNAYKYKQFCIEYECNNKPSGIETTTADYYAYFSVNPNKTYDLYIIPVIDIKTVIKEYKYNCTKIGGDRKASKFYIIDFDLFKQYKHLN